MYEHLKYYITYIIYPNIILYIYITYINLTMVCSFYSFHLLPPFQRFSKAPPPECWGVSVASLPWHSFNGWNMLEPRKLSPAEEMILSFLPIKRICKVNDGEWNIWNLLQRLDFYFPHVAGKDSGWQGEKWLRSHIHKGIWDGYGIIVLWNDIYIYNIEAWVDGTLRIDNTP